MKAFLLLAACISVAVAFPQYNYDPPPSVPSGLYELPSEPSNQEETKELLNEPTSLDNAKLPFSPVISEPAPPAMMPMPYAFEWGVNDSENGLDFAHDEVSSDGVLTKGSYRVLLPNGRTQVVTFTVNGDNGYVAKVQYQK
ncbi:cuticle protein 19-like [Artemia franciscana]|uniref:Cuticle protein n=1 Tax=Artemia franciscana TaxID=6661 RepID=A0AA88HAZ5_ARTSF|nr:hypothetical protein QYM36_014868 [Artemia franciscana]